MTNQIVGRTVYRAAVHDSTIVIDLKLGRGTVLLASLDRSSPAIFLSRIDRVQFEQGARNARPFALALRKHLSSATLAAFGKDPGDRVVRLGFESSVSLGKDDFTLVLSLTGRSANAWLIDSKWNNAGSLYETAQPPPLVREDHVLLADGLALIDESASRDEVLSRFFKEDFGLGPVLSREFVARCENSKPVEALNSLIDDLRAKPVPRVYSNLPLDQIGTRLIDLKRDLLLSHIELRHASGMLRNSFTSLSGAAEAYDQARARANKLQTEYSSVKRLVTRMIRKYETTLEAIEKDRARFDDPEKLKRIGDLLLANLATARVKGSRAVVVDYFDPNQREIAIELPKNKTPQQAAAEYFSRYQKARRASSAIASRLKEVTAQLEPARKLLAALEHDPTSTGIAASRQKLKTLTKDSIDSRPARKPRSSRESLPRPGRRFISSNGYEVLVGKNDRDNDAITFRVARSNDLWMHAADYPGSHVVVLNRNRNPIPQQTIREAAELAAFYSQARREGKAAVHYTTRKFVSRPPRAKPGLVRLSSFKTILVQPRCALKRTE